MTASLTDRFSRIVHGAARPHSGRAAWLAAVVIAVSLLSGCGRTESRPVSIAVHVWPGFETLFLARGEGWLDAGKVRLVETASASDSLRALAESKVDGAALTMDEMLSARARGIPLSAVMVFDVSAGADMLVARPGIKRLADIRGLRIGYEHGAVGSLMLAGVLGAAGLSKEEVRLVPVTIERHLDAWVRNEVDALITYEPVAGKLLDLGANRLFDSRQIPDTIIDVLAMRDDALDKGRAEAVRHLISAHFLALDYLNRNPQDAAYRMAAHLSLPATGVLPAYWGLLLPDAEGNRHMLRGDTPQLQEAARRVSAMMAKEELLQDGDTFAALARDEFLPRGVPGRP